MKQDAERAKITIEGKPLISLNQWEDYVKKCDKEQTETFKSCYDEIIETFIQDRTDSKIIRLKQLHEQDMDNLRKEKDKEIKELTKTILYTNNNYMIEHIKVKEKEAEIEKLKQKLKDGGLI